MLNLYLTTKPCFLPNGKTMHINKWAHPIFYYVTYCFCMWFGWGIWGTSDECSQSCTICTKQVQESKYHSFIKCSAFDHIWIMLSTNLRPNPILAQISLKIIMCTLNCNIHWKVHEHQGSLLPFTRTTWKYFIGHLTSNDDKKTNLSPTNQK